MQFGGRGRRGGAGSGSTGSSDGGGAVTAKLGYDNDGPPQGESCTLHVPGPNDVTDIAPTGTDTVVMQKVVTSDVDRGAHVSCTGDGDDDAVGMLRITAVRLD